MSYLTKFSLVICLLFLFLGVTNGQQRYNVKDYGAKGDGITNDVTSIRKALLEAQKNGGVIYFPKGTYLTDVLDIKPSVGRKIKFLGDSGAILRKNPNDPLAVALVFCELKNAELEFENLIFDGNYMLRPRNWKTVGRNTISVDKPTAGIYIYNISSLTVKNCVIRNFHGNGIAMFEGKSFSALNNEISNVSINGIYAHKVFSTIVRSNKITNAGLVTDQISLDGKTQKYNQELHHPSHGDGILLVSNNAEVKFNTITNSGRCGIAHDLAKDVGIPNSRIVVESNLVTVSSSKINSNNPPAGMWFEQTGSVILRNNTIDIKVSHYPLASGIRFFDITSDIELTGNIIKSTSSNTVNDGIGVYEPNKLRSLVINDNQIQGDFKRAISFSYEKNGNTINTVLIADNLITPGKKMENFISMSVYGKNSFPSVMDVKSNKIKSTIIRPLDLKYFGTVSSTKNKSSMRFNNNNMGGTKITNKIDLKNVSITNE